MKYAVKYFFISFLLIMLTVPQLKSQLETLDTFGDAIISVVCGIGIFIFVDSFLELCDRRKNV
jgi:hypothetical protein